MLPVDYSETGATGAAAAAPVAVTGIKTGDVLLALISWAPAADPDPVDTTDYTVGDGTITGATISTANKSLWVMWTTPRE